MDNSPFSRLSPELRNQIYHLVLQQPHPIQVRKRSQEDRDMRRYLDRLDTSQQNRPQPLALTMTCRAIRDESTQLFFAANVFCFTYQDIPTTAIENAREFLDQLSASSRLAVRGINIVSKGSFMSACLRGASATFIRDLQHLSELAERQAHVDFQSRFRIIPGSQRTSPEIVLRMRDLEMSARSHVDMVTRERDAFGHGSHGWTYLDCLRGYLKDPRDTEKFIPSYGGWISGDRGLGQG